jgi:hypothetical protein
MSAYSRLLARAGIILFALSLINGFLVHVLALRDQALAAHLIGLIGALFLLALACLWPMLDQNAQMSGLGALLAVYGFGMGWLVNFAAAITGYFGLFPISVGAPGGRAAGDWAISIGLLTVVVALFTLCGVVLRGLRGNATKPAM